MAKQQPVIKWSGSKGYIAKSLCKYFPKEIDTYYEPFVGGGSVMIQLIQSDIKVNKLVCSDLNQDLINFWNILKDSPQELLDNYTRHYNAINSLDDIEKRKEYYYQVRKDYNESKSVHDFYFLTRNAINGLIRYNSKGLFNSPYHFSRPGINPAKLAHIIELWHTKISNCNIEFVCQDYSLINSGEGDVIYLDPPYFNSKEMYFGNMDHIKFWEWMANQKGKYYLSFDGQSDLKDKTYQVPSNLYTEHIYMDSAISGFSKLHSKNEYIKESLYIK